MGGNQSNQYFGIPYLTISLNSVYSQCTIEFKYGDIMEQKLNKVNTFWAAYYDAAAASGVPEKTAECYVNWAQKFAISIKGKNSDPVPLRT